MQAEYQGVAHRLGYFWFKLSQWKLMGRNEEDEVLVDGFVYLWSYGQVRSFHDLVRLSLAPHYSATTILNSNILLFCLECSRRSKEVCTLKCHIHVPRRCCWRYIPRATGWLYWLFHELCRLGVTSR